MSEVYKAAQMRVPVRYGGACRHQRMSPNSTPCPNSLPLFLNPQGSVWQRWRVLHSSVQGVVILQVLNAKTMKPADKCEIMLYAKDCE